MLYTLYTAPHTSILLTSNGEALTSVQQRATTPPLNARHDPAWFAPVIEQLDAYFAGTLTNFDLPLAPTGTPFQQRVWAALKDLPYGTTTSYGALAHMLGDPKLTRAVGSANGRNPIGIIIPCHRVIGADGSLTGYAGGLENKRFLLDLEAKHAGVPSPIQPTLF
ncbi:MAG: methylated-DNA--[protein]-cysteine S-methyltransferase [Rhodothermales bacterium]